MSCFGGFKNKLETALKEHVEKMMPMIEERLTKIVEEKLKTLQSVTEPLQVKQIIAELKEPEVVTV
jgi:hypothetical protein